VFFKFWVFFTLLYPFFGFFKLLVYTVSNIVSTSNDKQIPLKFSLCAAYINGEVSSVWGRWKPVFMPKNKQACEQTQ